MSVFIGYRNRRREISTTESTETLDHMKKFFGNGQNWAQHVYQGTDGGRCLVAAAEHVRISPIDDAKHWLRMAIKEKTGLDSIEQFNDTRSSFEEIKEIIGRAKELARTGGAKAVALVSEVLPPVRAALPAPIPVAALPAVQANRLPVAANPWAAPANSWSAPVAPTPPLPTLFNGGGQQGWAAPRPAAQRRTTTPRPSFWDWTD